MSDMWLVVVIAVSVLLVLGLLTWLILRTRQPVSPEWAMRQFQQQREHLEADFLRAAGASGKPRGLRWKECDWDSGAMFARDRKTRELTALVGVTIQFEAIAGSDMEGLPAVANLRHASGVFFFRGGRWRTIGKAVFNLNPGETIEHFKQQYERVELM